jgi:hypothetical protein
MLLGDDAPDDDCIGKTGVRAAEQPPARTAAMLHVSTRGMLRVGDPRSVICIVELPPSKSLKAHV